VIDSGVLGRPLAARLTNCAFDTLMPPEHWFWNKAVSGGIFIEHGVHFFDLYAYWLGPGRVIDAHAERREGSGIEDRVTCTVRHDSGAIVSHYHGFDQIQPMDRADHRLVCELGDLRVAGWIPLTLTVDAAVDEQGADKLLAACPGCAAETVATWQTGPILGRGVPRAVTKRLRLTCSPNNDKQAVYAGSIRALLADQIAFIRDRRHRRRVTEADGLTALATAEEAAGLSDAIGGRRR